ncbi:MAG: phosphate ABC transporter substrate-binding protein [Alphaproteobacteria bacterium]|nr:phosphate ABC transporter substrate-binding protein [Alphaproteobacteria bacterium]
MNKFKTVLVQPILAMLIGVATVSGAQARDQIEIVGSSTVFPFATAVAEQCGRTSKFKTPVVESTGSGGGLKLFCAGIGLEHPDITNASRRIKGKEFKNCQAKGIDITEIVVGFDGIVLANAKGAPQLNLTGQQIYLATAKMVPNPDKPCQSNWCEPVKNPYMKWSDIDASLPDVKIEILGPPPTSGTRDAFQELAMSEGANKFPHMKKLKKADKSMWKKLTRTVREDGAWIDAGENDNLMVQKLSANPKAVGVFGFSFLDQNSDRLKGAIVEGIEPNFENIADGKYGISRSLYFYIKQAHVGTVPGISEYVAEFTSEKAFGEDGYLVDKGLIPLPASERQKYRNDGKNLTKLSM